MAWSGPGAAAAVVLVRASAAGGAAGVGAARGWLPGSGVPPGGGLSLAALACRLGLGRLGACSKPEMGHGV